MNETNQIYKQMCSNENINYLKSITPRHFTIPELRKSVEFFLINYKGYYHNYQHLWPTIRLLNREFIESTSYKIDISDRYSTYGDYIFNKEEVEVL